MTNNLKKQVDAGQDRITKFSDFLFERIDDRKLKKALVRWRSTWNLKGQEIKKDDVELPRKKKRSVEEDANPHAALPVLWGQSNAWHKKQEEESNNADDDQPVLRVKPQKHNKKSRSGDVLVTFNDNNDYNTNTDNSDKDWPKKRQQRITRCRSYGLPIV